MNYAIKVLKIEETVLEGELKNPTSDLSVPLNVYYEVIRKQLKDIRQSITDLEEKDMQRQMVKEAGNDS